MKQSLLAAFVAAGCAGTSNAPIFAQSVPFERDKPLVPFIHAGQKPDSMFGSSLGRDPVKDAPRLAEYGVKWLRGGPLPDEQAKTLGVMQMPILGFWNRKPEDSMNPASPYGAPKPEAVDRAIQQQLDIIKAHPEITAVEFYNEHWWMYSGATMARFRDDLKRFYTAVKAYNPKIVVVTGNTPSAIADDIAINGGEQYCDGFAPHNYVGNAALSFHEDPFWRYLDWSHQQTEFYHKQYQWMTEGGEWRLGDRDNPNYQRPLITMAYKMVQRFSVHPQLGIQKTFAFMHDKNWSSDEMYDAYKILTTVLEDKKFAAEVWPTSMLNWGSVFEGQGQSVAILWSLSGHDPLKADAGRMTLHNAENIAAYDVLGQPTGTYNAAQKSLVLDLGNPPAYLISNLPAVDLNAAIHNADIALNEPIKAMIEPLCGPVGANTPIRVRLYNGGVKTHRGTVNAKVAGWTTQADVPFEIAAGKFAIVEVPVLAANANASNVYEMTADVATEGVNTPLHISQPVQAAYMVAKTPVVDGDLSEWKNNVPVSLATYEKGLDFNTLVLNPALMSKALADGKPPITNALLHLYSAYDKNNLYIAYELTGKEGAGDWVQLGLGLNNWPGRNFRKQGDDWALKGYFNDTDYIFALNDPAGQIWRLAAPNAPWHTPYNWIIQTIGGDAEKNPRFVSDPAGDDKTFYDVVKKGGARIAIKNADGKRTVECAIPRALIPEFNPENHQPIRLSFILHQSPAIHQTTYYEWGKVAGEFPFMKSEGSFIPSWQTLYPNQLHWGVAP